MAKSFICWRIISPPELPDPPIIDPIVDTSATVGVLKTITPTNSGGMATSWSATGLSDGAAIDSVTGVVTWTPTVETTLNITITATNSGGSDDEVVAITSSNSGSEAPVLASPGNRWVALSQTISTIPIVNTGGGSVTYTSTGDALPTGLSLNSSTGDITGTVDAGAATGVLDIEITGTNGSGSDAASFQMDVRAAYTTISSADTFPYRLNTANRLFVLTEDITVDGSAFAATAANMVLDLNGYNVTYNDATPITIPNGSFETGTGAAATGWDFTNAPNAERFAGVFLQNEIYDGDYGLRFTDVTQSEYVDSTGTIELLANTTYSLSCMMYYGDGTWNPGIAGYVSLIGPSTYTVTRGGAPSVQFTRGMQLVEYKFTTGGSAETCSIRVGTTAPSLTTWSAGISVTTTQGVVGPTGDFYVANNAGTTGATPPTHTSGVVSDGTINWRWSTFPFYIDDIKVQQTGNCGLALSPSASFWPEFISDIIWDGTSSDFVLTGGTFTQGQNNGTWCSGVYNDSANNATVDRCTIIVTGANSSAIYARDIWGTALRAMNIRNNTFTSNVNTITTRDHAHGAVIHNIVGTIEYNTITNGPHVGIHTIREFVPSTIRYNTIQLKAKYTNAFAIIGNPRAQVYGNVISNGSGEYESRGIMMQSGLVGDPSRCYNNTVTVQELDTNQEYEGANAFGVYGIQLEDVSYCEVYGNTVTANANIHKAAAFRINGDVSSTGVIVHDNTFIADAVGAHATCLRFATVPEGSISFYDNTLITNDGIFQETADTVIDCEGTTITVLTPYGSATPTTTESPYGNVLRMVDTTFSDVDSENYVGATTVLRWLQLDAENNSTFSVAWTVTITVQDAATDPVEGAMVTIEDVNANEVFSGTTDANGQVVAILSEYDITGTTKTGANDHTITATFETLSGTQSVTADTTKSATITIT